MEPLQHRHDGSFGAAWKAKGVALHKNAVFRTEPNRELVRVNAKTLFNGLRSRRQTDDGHWRSLLTYWLLFSSTSVASACAWSSRNWSKELSPFRVFWMSALRFSVNFRCLQSSVAVRFEMSPPMKKSNMMRIERADRVLQDPPREKVLDACMHFVERSKRCGISKIRTFTEIVQKGTFPLQLSSETICFFCSSVRWQRIP